MKIIFATTNNRKLEDIVNVIEENHLNLEVVSLNDIGWDRGEIEENGSTIQENSLIKANAVYDFCEDHGIKMPIVTDDSGLFVESLNGAPGIFTARYADEEIAKNPKLPKHYAIDKMLKNMDGKENRNAEYRCSVTVMFDNRIYEQFDDKTEGYISTEISEPIKKPYLYSLFIDKATNKPFNTLSVEELKNTYRHKALKTTLIFLNNQLTSIEK